MDRRKRRRLLSALQSGILEDIRSISNTAIASFTGDGRDLVRLVVGIEPIQAGSGDPSPDNVRPISGWTEATVTRTGKNLWKPSFFTDNGFTESGGVYSGSSLDLNGVVLSIPPTDRAVMSLEYKGETTSRAGYFKFVYSDGSNNYPIDCKEDVWTTKTAVSTSGKTVIGIIFGRSNTVNMEVRNFQLELGSTATAYEAYQGQTYTIDLDGTRYGGTLDVTSGKLTVDRAMVDMGTLNYTYDSSGRFYTSINGKKNEASDQDMMLAISSMYMPMTATTFQNTPTNGTMRGATTGGYVYFRNDAYTDAATFKTAMSGVQLVYELATPIEVDLTPTQITTLSGANNIWADTGDIILLEYMA